MILLDESENTAIPAPFLQKLWQKRIAKKTIFQNNWSHIFDTTFPGLARLGLPAWVLRFAYYTNQRVKLCSYYDDRRLVEFHTH